MAILGNWSPILGQTQMGRGIIPSNMDMMLAGGDNFSMPPSWMGGDAPGGQGPDLSGQQDLPGGYGLPQSPQAVNVGLPQSPPSPQSPQQPQTDAFQAFNNVDMTAHQNVMDQATMSRMGTPGVTNAFGTDMQSMTDYFGGLDPQFGSRTPSEAIGMGYGRGMADDGRDPAGTSAGQADRDVSGASGVFHEGSRGPIQGPNPAMRGEDIPGQTLQEGEAVTSDKLTADLGEQFFATLQAAANRGLSRSTYAPWGALF